MKKTKQLKLFFLGLLLVSAISYGVIQCMDYKINNQSIHSLTESPQYDEKGTMKYQMVSRLIYELLQFVHNRV